MSLTLNNKYSVNLLPSRDIVPMTKFSDRTWLVSTSEAKEHLRVSFSDDDTYILRLTQAAQMFCETYTGQVFTPMTYTLFSDDWEGTMIIPNVSSIDSINSIKYWDDATPSVQQTWSATEYGLAKDIDRSRIYVKDTYSYPNLRNGLSNVEVEFDCEAPWERNSSDSGLDMLAKQAILITIADMYENRQSVVVGRIASSIPRTAEYLLDSMRIQRI